MGRVVDEKSETGLAARSPRDETHGQGAESKPVRYPGELRRHHFHDEVGDIQADDFGYFTLPVVAVVARRFVVEAATEVARVAGSRGGRSPAWSTRRETGSLTLDGDERSGRSGNCRADRIRRRRRRCQGFGSQSAPRGRGQAAPVARLGDCRRRAAFSAPCASAEPAHRHWSRRGLRVQGPACRKSGGDRPRAGQDARQEGTGLVGTGFTRGCLHA